LRAVGAGSDPVRAAGPHSSPRQAILPKVRS
jgi:hypothetical protein